jgi:two-component system, chemotaxis family, sensor kinase CheA
MDEKRKKYLKIFRAEADEHLATINRRTLEIEQGQAGPDAIHDLLRSAHTLKGSSRMVGLTEIGDIAHKMEDIMKAVETGTIASVPEVFDRMLEGADAIAKLVDPNTPAGQIDVPALVAKLAAVCETPAAAPPAPVAAPEIGARVPSPAQPLAPAPPAPAPAPEKKVDKIEAAASEARQKADTLRVPAERLDRLVDYSGELLISKIKLESRSFAAKQILDQMTEVLGRFDAAANNGGREQLKAQLQEVRNQYHELALELAEDIIELDLNVQEIQSSALQLRMIPASTLFDEFPRLVRDLSRDLGKDIRLQIDGQDTELDKRLLEQLRGPLVHLIRNCCDHGIEKPELRQQRGKPASGTVKLSAYHQGSSVIVEVADDGAGMDPDRIRETAVARGLIDRRTVNEMSEEELVYLTLRPGFSTSAIITDLSGRGVGLDVVKTNVDALRGDLRLESHLGLGSRIELRLPLTVSIIEALLVQQGGDVYAIPLPSVEEVVRIKVSDLVLERGREMVPVRGRLLSLVRMGELLKLAPLPGFARELKSSEDILFLIVLRFRNQRLALEVDAAVREQEILVKPLGVHLAGAPFVSGATILRRGEPALILNVADVFAEAERTQTRGIKEQVTVREREARLPRILVVDDSITTRTIEKNILERAGYEVISAVSAEDALEVLGRAETMFDLFVVDVDMPGISGFELTEKLRADPHTEPVPVIILTSRSSDEDKRRGISVGAQAYIVKGAFDQNVLLETVKSLIGD